MRRQQVIVLLLALAASLSAAVSVYYFAISGVEHGQIYGSIWIVTTVIWLHTVWVATGTAYTIGEIKVLKEQNDHLRVKLSYREKGMR
jgi:Ca2+/Na+ antiporter